MSKCEECLHNKVCHLREVCTEEEMPELDNCEDYLCAVGSGYLEDWYIHSLAEYADEKLNEPRWTEAHIEELTNDFIVIPK